MSDFFDLKNIFSCNYCNCILKSPVFLPCSEKFCESHVAEIKSRSQNVNSQVINCYSCKKDHSIPAEGFPKDLKMAKLIENRFHQMDLGKEHKKAIDSCKEMEKMIDKLENLTKDPKNFLNGYFDKIINEIDLLREESKLKIDQWHENCFKKIQTYKMNCSAKLKSEYPEENLMISNFKAYLNIWQKKLIIPELSNQFYSFQKIDSNAESVCLTLNAIYEAFKTEVLLENGYELRSFYRKISIKDFPIIITKKKVT